MNVEMVPVAGTGRLRLMPDPALAARLASAKKVNLGLSEVRVVKVPAHDGERLSLGAQRGRFHLPYRRWRVGVREDEDALTLGPVIAIFTSSSRRHSRRRFASLSTRFRLFVELAHHMGAIAYVFTPKGVHWDSRTITGHTWIGGRWVKGTFPFPNVVYNRVPTRKAENRPAVRRVRRRLLDDPEVHFFNPEFLDKWQVYQILRDVDGVKEHLPQTRRCPGGQELIPFLERHRKVYLKMAGGSLGRGTARVDMLQDGRLRWRHTRSKGHITRKVLKDPESLKRLFRAFKKGRTYLMQEAVPLLTSNGRPFDVRALVQKDVDKGWSVTGMAARIAGPRQITTHRPRGGSRARLAPLLETVFANPEKAKDVQRELERVIVRAAEAFDAATDCAHGELSMDVAIDRHGKPWILELNAKPAVFDEPSIRKFARRRLLDYCFRKCGFETPKSAPILEDASTL